jgi:O-succinylhomoserine sulfhydrylase
MSAILLLGLALLRSGDHVVSSAQVFGSTVSLFTKILPRFGIEVDFVPVSDTRAWKSALSK